ncbi:hypothetical protein FRC11_012184, partial [Ceratobasidium sp. 423]
MSAKVLANPLTLLETCVDKHGAVWAIHQQVVTMNKEAHEAKGDAKVDKDVLFRTLPHVFKTILAGGCDGDKEAFEMLFQVFHEIELHIFQDVWTTEMQFFIDHVQDHQKLLAIKAANLANYICGSRSDPRRPHVTDPAERVGCPSQASWQAVHNQFTVGLK